MGEVFKVHDGVIFSVLKGALKCYYFVPERPGKSGLGNLTLAFFYCFRTCGNGGFNWKSS